MYRLIDLFSGAGGMALGFLNSKYCGGFECVLSIENDAAAIETYRSNFSGIHLMIDIERYLIDACTDIPKADIVIGGPPCQGFSLLNKDRRDDPRRALWEPYLEITVKSGATVFVMENVPELLRSQEMERLNARAEEYGFVLHAQILNAADYGVPQSRKRAIIIGAKKEIFHGGIALPQPPHTHILRTVRDAIGDLPEPEGTDIRNVPPPLDLHFGRTPTELSKKRYRAVPPGGNRFDLQRNAPELTPDCWVRKISGGTDLFGRLWWDRPSVTIRTEFFKPEKGRYLHPEKDRPITHREAARLMSFPDDFVFKGTKVQIARQIGNAVPPILAGAVAKQVKASLDAIGKQNTEKRKAS